MDAPEETDLSSQDDSPAEESDNPTTFRPDVSNTECNLSFELLKVGLKRRNSAVFCVFLISLNSRYFVGFL